MLRRALKIVSLTLVAFVIIVAVVHFNDLLWLYHVTSGFDAFNHSKLAQAESHFSAALENARSFSLKDQRVVSTTKTLADILMSEGKYDRAEPLVRRVTEMAQQEHGIESRESADALSLLAGFYRRQGKYDKAMPIYERVIAIKKNCEGETVEFAETLVPVAKLYFYQGDYLKSKRLYDQAFGIYREKLEKDDLHFAGAFDGLGDIQEYLGRYKSADETYNKALDIGTTHGDNHAIGSALTCKETLAMLEDNYPEALKLADEATQKLDQSKGLEFLKVSTLTSMTNKAIIFTDQGKLEDARRLLTDGEQIAVTRLGPNHPGYAWVLSARARLEQKEGKNDQALDTEKKALAVLVSTLGPKHRWVAKELASLGTLYCQQKKFPEAETDFLDALKMEAQVMPPKHPDRAYILKAYAKLLSATGKEDEAKKAVAEADEIMAKAKVL